MPGRGEKFYGLNVSGKDKIIAVRTVKDKIECVFGMTLHYSFEAMICKPSDAFKLPWEQQARINCYFQNRKKLYVSVRKNR